MGSKIGEYKGHKTLSLFEKEDDKFPFTFGVKKAKLILDNLEEVKKFAESE